MIEGIDRSFHHYGFFLLPVSRSRIRTRIGRFFIIHRDRWSLLSSGTAEYLERRYHWPTCSRLSRVEKTRRIKRGSPPPEYLASCEGRCFTYESCLPRSEGVNNERERDDARAGCGRVASLGQYLATWNTSSFRGYRFERGMPPAVPS